MNPQTVDFDGFACPACILLTIVSNDAQLKRFVETTDLERLERWLDRAEECTDEDVVYTLLWVITPIVHSTLEGKTSQRVHRWLTEPRVRAFFRRPMLMNKTKKFANVLANALDSIPFAADQEELRLKLLEQLLPHNLRMDLLLRRCYPCGHYPIITNAFSSLVNSTYQEWRGSAPMEVHPMEVDSWSE